jgi:F-box and WD-40 domain protein CDC4
MDIPRLLDTYDMMPDELKTYVMYQLLRRSAKPTLHLVADVVNPALKCDFIGMLPYELSLNILRFLDYRSLCRAAQVSKKWRHIVNSNEKGWKDLLTNDDYSLTQGELERAVREGWGWQYPHSSTSFERDLSTPHGSRSDSDSTSASPPRIADSFDSDATSSSAITSTSSRPKRKAAAKFGSNKRQRRKAPTPSKYKSPSWMQSLESASGPLAYSNAAAQAVPNPQVGLPSLRELHLFKTLYQRHHLIRKSWMDMDTRPRHIAFRAHNRHVVTCLQFDTDKILTGSDDTNIDVYDAKTGALRNRLEGHEGGVWALQYEGNTLVSGSTDRSVRVWDIEKGQCTQIFQGHTSTVRCLVILKPTVIGRDTEGKPIVMPKEPLIITGSRDSSLRVWKLPQPGDKPFLPFGAPAGDYANPYFVRVLTGHHQSVRAIAAHGDTLVSGSYDTSVRVWKISTGDLLHRLQGHQQKVYSVVLDHERNRCISGSMDNLVKVWSLDTGACLFNLEGHTSLVGLLDLSHGRLVSAAADSTLRIWDPESGRCKSTLSAHTGAITCFQHDNQKVISGSDRTLKMWDVRTGECIKDLLTDLNGVWQVKFNDRRCVAAVKRDRLTYIEVSIHLSIRYSCHLIISTRFSILALLGMAYQPINLVVALWSILKERKLMTAILLMMLEQSRILQSLYFPGK